VRAAISFTRSGPRWILYPKQELCNGSNHQESSCRHELRSVQAVHAAGPIVGLTFGMRVVANPACGGFRYHHQSKSLTTARVALEMRPTGSAILGVSRFNRSQITARGLIVRRVLAFLVLCYFVVTSLHASRATHEHLQGRARNGSPRRPLPKRRSWRSTRHELTL
jgi:hypothetical protein